MQGWRLAAVAISLSFLTACGSTPIGSTVRVVNSSSYPSLPDIPPLPELDLMPFEYDMPRDANGKVISNSNIFLGFDLKNWQIMLNNFKILEGREQMWRTRVEEVNRQRAEWRKLNEQSAIP